MRRSRCGAGAACSACRVESGRSLLTFKGPVQPSPVKVREEIETVVGDGETLLRCLEQLGFSVWFRYQKYREEYALSDTIVAIDETPVGVFVEIEGDEHGIIEATRRARQAAGRLRPRLVPRRSSSSTGARAGLPTTDMLFEDIASGVLPTPLIARVAPSTGARARGGPRHAPAAADPRSAPSRRFPSPARRSSSASFGWLAGHGVTDLIVNLHYRPETITARARRRQPSSACACATRGSSPLLGSAGGPRRAFSLARDERFWLVNGDTLADVPLGAMAEAHRSSDALVTMAVIPNPDPIALRRRRDRRWWRRHRASRAAARWAVVAFRRRADRRARGVRGGFPTARPRRASARSTLRSSPSGPAASGRSRARPPFHDIGTPADYLAACLALADTSGGAAGRRTRTSPRIAQRGAVRPVGGCRRSDPAPGSRSAS